MKRLTGKLWAKAVAVVLAVIMALTVLGCVFGVYVFTESDAYLDDGASMRRGVADALTYRWCGEAENYYNAYAEAKETGAALDTAWVKRFSEENSNFFFTITDADGNILLQNYEASYQTHIESQFSRSMEERDLVEEDLTFSSAEEREAYWTKLAEQYDIFENDMSEDREDGSTIYHLHLVYSEDARLHIDGYLRSDLKADDGIRKLMDLADRLIALRYGIFWIGGVALLALIALVVFLLCAAGHRETDDRIHLSWFDRIPFDLLLCAGLLGLFAPLYFLDWGYELFAALAVIPVGLWWLALLLTFAVRAKAGTLWKNNLTTMALRLCWRCLKGLGGAVRDLLRSIPLFWRTGLLWCGGSLLELLAIFASNADAAAFVWFLEKLILTPLLFFAVIAMQRLQKGAKLLADGDLTQTVDLKHIYGPFRQHGAYLNSISDGMQTAVDERVKSERMKAELITNVSHDIKTPLTSIVNYVDLLKKEPPANERAAEYLNVLDRQSQRLKKLTEDLVEASKASTGNIAVHAERTDLNVLLGQAAGEFADRFEQRRLTTVRMLAPEQPCVMADGQLLWRVFSNLLSNIHKYAMEGTRVYLSTAVRGGSAEVTFRNISGAALNITADELTERFVRGDRARSGEGSGLGLSIAKSLTELMGGAFTVSVDGDLFKVTLAFPAL